MPLFKWKKQNKNTWAEIFFCRCHTVLVLRSLLSLKRKLPQSLLALQNLFQIPSLSASPPLFIWNIYFPLTREELLLILPWNSGQYSGAVLGYLIKSQYVPLSLASTSGNDFAQGRLCVCARVWCVLLEMNCFGLFSYWLCNRTAHSPRSVSHGFLSGRDADESKAVTAGQQSLLASLSRELLPQNLRQAGADR